VSTIYLSSDIIILCYTKALLNTFYLSCDLLTCRLVTSLTPTVGSTYGSTPTVGKEQESGSINFGPRKRLLR
jgi:hypothetical protein